MEVGALDLLNWVRNDGFAIAVAIYSLTRLERSMKENTLIMKEIRLLIGGETIAK